MFFCFISSQVGVPVHGVEKGPTLIVGPKLSLRFYFAAEWKS